MYVISDRIYESAEPNITIRHQQNPDIITIWLTILYCSLKKVRSILLCSCHSKHYLVLLYLLVVLKCQLRKPSAKSEQDYLLGTCTCTSLHCDSTRVSTLCASTSFQAAFPKLNVLPAYEHLRERKAICFMNIHTFKYSIVHMGW